MSGGLVERLAVKVPLSQGERARRELLSRGLLDRGVHVERSGGYLLLPLAPGLEPEEAAKLTEAEVVRWRFRERPSRPKDLVEALQGRLPPFKLAFLPSSYDLIGDVAIVELPPELEEDGEAVAQGIMLIHRRVRTVYAKAGFVEGEFRVRPLKLLKGVDNPVTLHRENGCLFKVDVSSVYFSPRLSTERLRVVKQVNSWEVVADLFAGVGPYAVQVAKHRGAFVYAVDLNPKAVELLRDNVKLNGVEDRVAVIQGDAKEVVEEELKGRADRVILHHPSQALNFLDVGSAALKREGGVLHVYSFAQQAIEVEGEVIKRLSKLWRRVEVAHRSLVKQVSPRRWEAVVDVKVAEPLT